MTAAVGLAILWRLAAIVAVIGVIIGRIRNLRAATKKGGSQNPETPPRP